MLALEIFDETETVFDEMWNEKLHEIEDITYEPNDKDFKHRNSFVKKYMDEEDIEKNIVALDYKFAYDHKLYK